MKERVVVAMSGGVDSSVSAALLKEQGYEVVGITMCFNLADSLGKKPTCCGLQAIEDARRVAHRLGIRHYMLNMQKALDKYVIKDFCQEYLNARTPNPCVRCNQYIKFNVLLKKTLSLGARYLATGHYARIVNRQQRYLLKKAKDFKKDQSYFLYQLKQWQLKHILLPLGEYSKDKVRGLARRFDLPVAEKLASQEICFLPNMDYRSFLKSKDAEFKSGYIIDKNGTILGRHKGVAFYTIGQRRGLGVALGFPLYVTEIFLKENIVQVGKKEEVYRKEFLVKEPNFILKLKKNKIALKVKVRYNHPEATAEVLLFDGKIKVSFKRPQFAITPGQSAVFYAKDFVAGGGIIDEVLD